MDDDSMRDRQNILLDLTAKNDKVWGIFRVVGTHTGPLYGIPETGRHIDVIEVGLWRVEDGLITEAWYFGDELGLLRALGLNPPDLTGAE
jgi:predicted ester cyclase